MLPTEYNLTHSPSHFNDQLQRKAKMPFLHLPYKALNLDPFLLSTTIPQPYSLFEITLWSNTLRNQRCHQRRIGSDKLTIIPQLSTGDYFVKTTTTQPAGDLTESGFACNDQHVSCNPPHGHYPNVSIVGVCPYVEDEDIIDG